MSFLDAHSISDETIRVDLLLAKEFVPDDATSFEVTTLKCLSIRLNGQRPQNWARRIGKPFGEIADYQPGSEGCGELRVPIHPFGLSQPLDPLLPERFGMKP